MKKWVLVCGWLVLLAFHQTLLAQGSQNTTLVGRWPGGICTSVYASDAIAYVGNGAALDILDISNPALPV
ncbi:MAG: hypothetical protein D6715_06130, partial [Calditrichaeota bacterium]